MRHRLKWLLPLIHRGIAVALVLTLIATTVGIPVIRPVVGPGGKDISLPFPCMDSRCGCMSAEACWRGCCCHTNVEKLAWARQHGIMPPAFVVEAAHKELASAPVSKSCCSTGCCTTADYAVPNDSGSGVNCDEHQPSWNVDNAIDSRPPRSAFSLVPILSARCCHGIMHAWLILSTALPAPVAVTWQQDLQPRGIVNGLTDALLSSGNQPRTRPPNA